MAGDKLKPYTDELGRTGVQLIGSNFPYQHQLNTILSTETIVIPKKLLSTISGEKGLTGWSVG